MILSGLIQIDRQGRQPVYLQIAEQLTSLIRNGTLPRGSKLLSSRNLADSLGVHRRTVVQAFEELLAQGWLESQAGSGTFVAHNLPEIDIKKIETIQSQRIDSRKEAGFRFEPLTHLNRKVLKAHTRLHLDDGFPDPRLAPLEELSRAYRAQMLQGNPYIRLGYGQTAGTEWLRIQLAEYLHETRGLNITPRNILIVRGVIMGAYLTSTMLLKPGDLVAIDSPGWFSANLTFVQAGAKVLPISVDAHGMIVEELEELCRKQTVRMVYVTSHHHYPTTVPLRADRRLKLLQLAREYGFIIFEDDYDYDFHYLSKPLMPLAGADNAGMVIYCGSFTKAISPAFRVGYLVAPEDVIENMAMLRRIIDRQGDQMLENAMAELLKTRLIQRHLRKSVRHYRQRRDFFCTQLTEKLPGAVSFQIPDGGMAVWAEFDRKIDLPRLASRALQHDLYLSDGTVAESGGSFTRLGFASSNFEELEESVQILRDLL